MERGIQMGMSTHMVSYDYECLFYSLMNFNDHHGIINDDENCKVIMREIVTNINDSLKGRKIGVVVFIIGRYLHVIRNPKELKLKCEKLGLKYFV